MRRLLHHPDAFTPAMLAYVGIAFVVEPFAGVLGSLILGLYEYRLAIGATIGWRLGGPTLTPRPDVAGAAAAVALVGFLARVREPTLFACVLFFVAVLELYGTAMGSWQWSTHVSGLHIPMANPPSGVAAGYCAFDALALRLGRACAASRAHCRSPT